MTSTQPDPEDAALKAALTGYSKDQIGKALALIARGDYKEIQHEGNTRGWLMQSATRPHVKYIVVDDGPDLGTWCNCPPGSSGHRCYHAAAAIMLRVHAEHDMTHRPWCGGNPETPHITATSTNPVCCDLDIRNSANAYDPFAVFDHLS